MGEKVSNQWIHTFLCDVNDLEQIKSFSHDKGGAAQIERLYRLKETHS